MHSPANINRQVPHIAAGKLTKTANKKKVTCILRIQKVNARLKRGCLYDITWSAYFLNTKRFVLTWLQLKRYHRDPTFFVITHSYRTGLNMPQEEQCISLKFLDLIIPPV